MLDRFTTVIEKPFPLEAHDRSTPSVGEFWVFVEDGNPVAVEFVCPCGCGHNLHTPLGLSSPHHWEYRAGSEGPTLSPSVRWTSGCKAHFTVTNGKIHWYSDSGK